MITIATGGIDNLSQIGGLADEGFDAVVVGRGLLRSQDPSALIREARARVGLQRQFLGMGLSAGDIM